MRILLIEDDDLLGSGLRAGLDQQGFQVDWVRDGFAGARELAAGEHAAAILDLGLPRQDGIEVLREARARGVNVPIVVLTARDAIPGRIEALDLGADDYLLKPIDLFELAARLRAVLRRSRGVAQPVLTFGSLVLDPAARRVSLNGEPITLVSREFDLLQALMNHPGQVLSREQLEQALYPWGREVSSNAIEVHVSHLRRKLGSEWIETVRGIGYRLPEQPPGAGTASTVAS